MINIAPVLTEAGENLLTRAIGGEIITFTRFEIGSGTLSNPDAASKINNLVNPVMDFSITEIDTTTAGFVKITGTFDSTDIPYAFEWRELGLYCKDSNEEEFLFAYANDGDNAGVIRSDATNVIATQSVTLEIAVDNAENITAVIVNKSDVLEQYKNFFNPDAVEFDSQKSRAYIDISGLTQSSHYVMNFIPNSIMGITSTGQEDVEFQTGTDYAYIPGGSMQYTELIIYFDIDLDPTYFMFVEVPPTGPYTVPEHFKPYGVDDYIKDEYLSSVYSADKKHRTSANLDHPDGSVTSSKIADGAITTSKIANETLTLEKFDVGLQQNLWDVTNHVADTTDNPHDVTKEQVGLGNVTNEEQATKAEYDNHRTASVIDHPDGSVTIEKLSDDIIKNYTNLLNPNTIAAYDTSASVSISGLTPGTAYCFNFQPYVIMGITETGAEEVSYTYADGKTVILPTAMLYESISISWDIRLYDKNLMFVEGSELPSHFKPYGKEDFINDDLLSSVYAEMPSSDETIIQIEPDNLGAVYLSPNKIYKLTISDDIRFAPVINIPDTTKFYQILIQANVTQPVSIDWGTTYFFGKEIPDIGVGTYNIIFEHDGLNWYAGVIEKGVAV